MSASRLPELLTAIEVAALLRCEPETIEERTRRRELPGLRFGRSWMYPREALIQVLNKLAMQQLEPSAAVAAPLAVLPLRMVAPTMPKSPRGLRRSPPPLPDPPTRTGLPGAR